MTRSGLAVLLLCVSLGAHAQGGAFGKTKGFVVTLDGTSAGQLRHSVGVGSIDVDSNANELDSVGTYHIGDFDDNERRIIEQSLADSLATIAWPSSGEPLEIHAVVRHYYVAHSNNDGGIVAGVAWALVAPGGRLVFSDEFYAAAQKSDMEKKKTLGHLKELINTAIVTRIAETSLAVAAAENPAAVTPVVAHLTHATVDEAAVGMPEKLRSFGGLPTFSRKTMDWTEGAPAEPFDWQAWLARR
jgi:hypothetical protein